MVVLESVYKKDRGAQFVEQGSPPPPAPGTFIRGKTVAMSDDVWGGHLLQCPSTSRKASLVAVRLTPHIIAAAFFVFAVASPAFCQAAGAAPEGMAPVFLILKGGAKVQADEVSEKPDGFWYRRGNMWSLLDRSKVERVEREEPAKESPPAAATKPAPPNWSLSDAARVESFYRKRFGRPLPVTAYGQSELHTRWGYDHRRAMDVGLHPDSAEGRALIAFLSREGIPFLGFRTAIPGVASAPHIHVGSPSRRLTSR